MKPLTTDEVSPATAAEERTPPLNQALAGLSLAMLLPSLGTSIANVGLPDIGHAFRATFQDVQWIVLAYILVTTALVVIAGRLGDLIGRRQLLLAGITLHTIASALCAAAPTLGLLIAARAVQGMGAAIMLALTMAFVSGTFPKDRIGRVMGLLGTMSALGTALGPSLGGLLIAGPGWRAIFLVNIPLGLVTLLLAHRSLPVDRMTSKPALADFDLQGTLLLALTLATYALAATTALGSLEPFNLAMWVLAAIGASLFLLTEARAASPLIRLAMLRDVETGAGFAMSALVSTVMMATLVIGPFYLARALQLDAAVVGAAMSVGPVVAAVSGVPAGRLVDHLGTFRTTLIGLIGMAAGACLLSSLATRLDLAGYVVPMMALTAGYALFQAANNTAVMAEVAPDQRGVVSGLLNLARNLGLITGASIMGTVFTLAAGTVDITLARPEVVATGMRSTFAVAAILIVLAMAVAVGQHGLATKFRTGAS